MAHIQLYYKAIYTNQVSINRAGLIYTGHRVRYAITVQELERRNEARELVYAEGEAQQMKEAAWQLSAQQIKGPLSAQQITNTAWRAQQKEAWQLSEPLSETYKSKEKADGW